MNLLLIDNYDSFTYNLVQLFRETGLCELTVLPYDKVNGQVIEDFDKIAISPGPGIPDDFPNLQQWILKFCQRKSFLGVCLGFEAIAVTFGGKLINSGKVFHGITKQTTICKPSHFLFKDIPSEIKTGLYHSWILQESCLPKSLEILAKADDGIIMAISHRDYDLSGTLFHPESIMTELGSKIIENWLRA